MKEFQCDNIIDNVEVFRTITQDIYKSFKKVIDENDVFDKDFFDIIIFKRAYGCVVTRCFGYGVPSTCLIPMADNMNHIDTIGSSYEIINPKCHLTRNRED